MPTYNPGITYNGDRYLYQGISNAGAAVAQGMQDVQATKEKADFLNSKAEGLAKMIGPDGQPLMDAETAAKFYKGGIGVKEGLLADTLLKYENSMREQNRQDDVAIKWANYDQQGKAIDQRKEIEKARMAEEKRQFDALNPAGWQGGTNVVEMPDGTVAIGVPTSPRSFQYTMLKPEGSGTPQKPLTYVDPATGVKLFHDGTRWRQVRDPAQGGSSLFAPGGAAGQPAVITNGTQAAPAAGSASPAAAAPKFKVGAQYRDASGRTKTYKGTDASGKDVWE